MKNLAFIFALCIGILFSACEDDALSTMNPNGDDTPPTLSLRGSATPAGGGANVTEEVIGNSPLGGAGANMTAEAGSAMIFVCDANDPQGVKDLKIWNIGCEFNDPSLGKYINTDPTDAYGKIKRSVTLTPLPGQDFEVYAQSHNFGGGLFGTTTASTGRIRVESSGNQPALPPNTLSTTVFFAFSSATGYYSEQSDPVPFGGPATIVGVEIGNPFPGSFISIYHGPEDDESVLDLYDDYKRLLPNTRVGFFNGPWVSGHWKGLRGLRPLSSSPGPLQLTVYYTQ